LLGFEVKSFWGWRWQEINDLVTNVVTGIDIF